MESWSHFEFMEWFTNVPPNRFIRTCKALSPFVIWSMSSFYLLLHHCGYTDFNINYALCYIYITKSNNSISRHLKCFSVLFLILVWILTSLMSLNFVIETVEWRNYKRGVTTCIFLYCISFSCCLVLSMIALLPQKYVDTNFSAIF